MAADIGAVFAVIPADRDGHGGLIMGSDPINRF